MNRDNSTTLIWENSAYQSELSDILRNDTIVIAETDTVVGLLGQMTENSRNHIAEIKQRATAIPPIVLAGSMEAVAKLADTSVLNEVEIRFLQSIWPGPVTVILKANKDLPTWARGPEDTVALRIPNHRGLLQLLTKFESLFSSSANRHGCKTPTTLEELDQSIVSEGQAIVANNEQYTASGAPSSIIDLSQVDSAVAKTAADYPFRVVRIGAFPVAHLKARYEKAVQS